MRNAEWRRRGIAQNDDALPSNLYLSTAALGVAGSMDTLTGGYFCFGPATRVDLMQNWQTSLPRHGLRRTRTQRVSTRGGRPHLERKGGPEVDPFRDAHPVVMVSPAQHGSLSPVGFSKMSKPAAVHGIFEEALMIGSSAATGTAD